MKTSIRIFLFVIMCSLCGLACANDAVTATPPPPQPVYLSVNVITGEFGETNIEWINPASPYIKVRRTSPDAEMWHYEYANHPFLKKKLLTRVDGPEGDFCINEYYDRKTNDVGGTKVIIDDPVRDPRIGRIKLQKGPVGADETPIITAVYFYFPGYTEVLDALGRKTIYRYNTDGYLTAIEEFNGSSIYRTERFFWQKDPTNDKALRLFSKVWEDASGKSIVCNVFGYDDKGVFVENTWYGNLSGTCTAPLVIDKNGVPQKNSIEFYTDKGPDRKQDSVQTKQTAVAEDTWSFEYGSSGQIVKASDGLGSSWEYDLRGNLILERTQKDNTLQSEMYNIYDAAGRIVRTDLIDDKGKITTNTFKYNVAGNKIESTDSFHNPVHYEHDDLGRIIKKTYPGVLDENDVVIHPTVYFEYDILNNLTKETDPNGNSTTTSYTAYELPAVKIYADGSRESFVYNLDGSLKKSTDRNGIATVYERDDHGRETSVLIIDAAGHIRNSLISTYSDKYLVKSVKDGQLTTYYHYNGDGKIAAKEQVFHEGSQKVSYKYDEEGRLVEQTESWGDSNDESSVIEFIYDAHGNRVKTLVRDAYGKILSESHDAQHHAKDDAVDIHESVFTNSRKQLVRQCTFTDAEGNVVTCTYDAAGRVESVNTIGCEIKHQELRYDAAGNKVKETSYMGGTLFRTDRWSYDPCNRVQSETIAAGTPLERTTHYYYNSAGQLETIIKPDGTVVKRVYSALGQLKGFYASDFSFKYHFIYDDRGNLITVEDLISNTVTARKYNTFNHVIHEELGNDLKLSSTYDAINRRTHLLLPDGSAINYTYDPVHLRSITRLSKASKELYSHLYSKYSLQGDPLEMSLIGAAGPLSLRYDGQQRCRSIHSKHWSEEIPGDGIDSHGNITSLRISDGQGTWQPEYSYDVMNRLVSERDDALLTYAYDDRSNRIHDNNKALTLDCLDQLTDSGNGVHYEYDLNGNMISKSVDGIETLYRYDALDRLVEVQKPNELLVNYTYDAFHRRLSKKVASWNGYKNEWSPTSNLHFLYDGDKEIGAVDNHGHIVELRLLGPGSLNIGDNAEIGAAIAIELNGTAYAPIHDHRGNVCCLVNALTGDTTEFYRYSAFGKQSIFSPHGTTLEVSAINNPWMFSSKRYDAESNLIYFGKRYYSPEIGRWITKDPLGEGDGPNPYIFLHQSPMASVDLYGLLSWSSAWNSTTSWMSSTANYLTGIKKKVSYTEHMQDEWDRMAHNVISSGFLQFSGYYQEHADSGHTHYGNEINDKVRVTYINGILNRKSDMDNSLKFFSKTHGDTVIHYVYRPTEGWSKDICYSILSKFGYTSPYSQLLARTWKELIAELGGTEGGGTIIHYAHSIGTADTYMAKNLLSPEERRMIHVYSIGSPTMIPNDTGFGNAVNYVSKRDGVCLLDPIGFIKGLVQEDSNVEFLGSFWGIPLIDHTLFTDSYGSAIRDRGVHFTDSYGNGNL